MASNLELKVRCPDPAILEARVALARRAGATYGQTLRQRDTYFTVSNGRLKVRQWWWLDAPGDNEPAQRASEATLGARREPDEAVAEGAELIAYARPDEAGTRRSDYIVTPAGSGEGTIAALALACGVRAVVEKRRLLYHYGATRIHFDTVTGLGHFIELETVLAPRGLTPSAAARAEHATVRELLDLARLEVVAGSYSELVLALPTHEA